MPDKFLDGIKDRNSIVTAIDTAIRFPELLSELQTKYSPNIEQFKALIKSSSSSAELLGAIRDGGIDADSRMSLLKMFRRCVSPVLDTEMTKKIRMHSTQTIVELYGHTFKPIETLKAQFHDLTADQASALAALIGEYDTRGQLGYLLTGLFFDWFETSFPGLLSIEGPRGAGRDIELSTVFKDFSGNCPCDFVIRAVETKEVAAIGFARYDSTRGGAQSDDRTGGNSDKVSKAISCAEKSGKKFRVIFLADGPGLLHGDTWAEACALDGAWDGSVRVTTLKMAPQRVTADWLLS